MPLLFAVTMFVSASLLFMVQPMVAKAVLPLLGGSPAVWNGCMVFFQALLLLGYLYADRLTRRTSTSEQWAIHLVVLALPVIAFVLAALFSSKHTPIAVIEALAPNEGSSPIVSVLAILTVAIGIPFFVCSTTATLLQKWFTYTGHPSARDPYFLYAASNFGSLISLLGYPFFIEPYMAQGAQTWFWAVGFIALAGLIALCGKAAANPLGVPPTAKIVEKPAAPVTARAAGEPPPSWARMAKWTALAFVPSSLMLGVTFHMTTDIASIPLLWVGPLALYLVTFIIAFSRVPAWFRILIGNLAPVMILLLVFLLISGVNPGVGLSLLLHLLTFFAAALMCHYELARDRPSPQHLTTYFLVMSFGGVLGGIFNSLLAPILFTDDYEYKLVLIVSCLMVPRLAAEEEGDPNYSTRRTGLILDIVIPGLVALAFWQLQKAGGFQTYVNAVRGLARSLEISDNTIHVIFSFALPVMVCFFFVDRPLRFALCVGAILGISVARENNRDVVRTERSFFGILKIDKEETYFESSFKDPDGKPIYGGGFEYLRLVHGTTLHGTQAKKLSNRPKDLLFMSTLDPWNNIAVTGTLTNFNMREEPLTYYHRTGPVGAIFSELRTRKGGADARSHVAMVGLGTGSVSCYAVKGQKLTFYEIDPAVKRLVADTDEYFTYVTDARTRGAELDFRLGDARLKLKEDVDRKYSLLLVDAFSSDSIPVHLLTTEAVQLYLDRLTDDGILALHISNKYVKLEPVVAAIAEKHNLVARVWADDAEGRPGKTGSSWVVLARKTEDLGDRIGSPLAELVDTYGSGAQLVRVLRVIYPELGPILDRSPLKQQDVVLEYLDKRTDAQSQQYAALVRKHTAFATTMTVLQEETGFGFRSVELNPDVPAWTDDFADVMRVMMIPELQAVRKFFGLKTPVER
ncbi:spermidine synthase [Gemmata sp. G18]|uniref:Spermidine synthase n=1 Tax=Gemmata palustris TaxID=2822762 RepID=A0ABS5BS84_9BACT|nr:fused MFS/spermidine synthase [Gemmata palustris]MBP3956558.1 spermidine synthase [Gemmata palustris]